MPVQDQLMGTFGSAYGGDQLDAVDRGADVPKPRGVSQDPFIGIEQKG